MINLDWIKVKNCPNCESDDISVGNTEKIEGEYLYFTMCHKCKTMVGTRDGDLNISYWNNIRRNK